MRSTLRADPGLRGGGEVGRFQAGRWVSFALAPSSAKVPVWDREVQFGRGGSASVSRVCAAVCVLKRRCVSGLSRPRGTRHLAVAGSVIGVAFYPFWDGIFDAGTTDHDDFVTVGRNAACGIRCGPPAPAPAPNPSVADGCCPGGATGPGFDKDCTQNYLRDVAFSGSGDWSATASCRAL